MSVPKNDLSDITVRDLVDMYGKEAVRRGISYMESLAEAEEEFKQSIDNDPEYAEQYTKGVAGDPEEVPESKREEINSAWAEGMREGGLGLDDE